MFGKLSIIVHASIVTGDYHIYFTLITKSQRNGHEYFANVVYRRRKAFLSMHIQPYGIRMKKDISTNELRGIP